jgi:hypothetical protein
MHFPNNEPVEPEWLVSCEERQKVVVETLVQQVAKMLHDWDADTVTIRRLLAEKIVQHEVDSPYTRHLENRTDAES